MQAALAADSVPVAEPVIAANHVSNADPVSADKSVLATNPVSVADRALAADPALALDPALPISPKPAAGPAEQALSQDTHVGLSPGVQEIAEEIGVNDLLEKLLHMRDPSELTDRQLIERLTLKQDLINAILQAMLEIHGVDARVNYEIAQATEIRAYFEDRRDRAIRLNSLANIVSGALVTGIGNSLDLTPHPGAELAGDVVELGGGGVQAMLGAYALKQSKGETRPVQAPPNMLAKVLGKETDNRTDLPPAVWKYLNTVPADAQDGETRRQRLLRRWNHLGLLSGRTPRDRQERIANLTSTVSGTHKLNIDLLDDRSRMLTDFVALVLQMERGLLELLQLVRTH